MVGMGMAECLIFMRHFVWEILKAAIFRVVDLFAQSPLRSTKLIHFCSFKLIHLTETEWEWLHV
jgi:hypothetical protein